MSVIICKQVWLSMRKVDGSVPGDLVGECGRPPTWAPRSHHCCIYHWPLITSLITIILQTCTTYIHTYIHTAAATVSALPHTVSNTLYLSLPDISNQFLCGYSF